MIHPNGHDPSTAPIPAPAPSETIQAPPEMPTKVEQPDFLVRYGFAGPIIIEVKLTSNADMKGNKIASSASYKSMQSYMDGFGAAHGVFLIVNNTAAKNLSTLRQIFETIPHVSVQIFDGLTRPSNPRGSGRTKRGTRKPKKIKSSQS